MLPSLISRAQAGDDLAWQELIETYREDVFRLAYLLLNNTEDAQDITQETFIRTLRYLHRFDETRPFRPWVLKIASNLCRNHKRNLRRYWLAVWTFNHEPDEAGLPIEKQIIQQEEVSAVLSAIRALRHAEQEIIYLRYFLDLSVAETAEVLNIKIGTVKSRLHRALQQLEFVIHDEHSELVEKRA
jgi:RNA polymerase sigma-70 factor (ECF subfamily)